MTPGACPGFLKESRFLRNREYHGVPARRTGPLTQSEREVAEENTSGQNWERFYKKIEVRGDSERRYSDEELNNLLEDLSQNERDVLAQRLRCLHFERAYPRVVVSVLEDVFYLIQTARWHLKHDAHREGIRETLAWSLHRLSRELEEAVEAARELEERTGIRCQDDDA